MSIERTAKPACWAVCLGLAFGLTGCTPPAGESTEISQVATTQLSEAPASTDSAAGASEEAKGDDSAPPAPTQIAAQTGKAGDGPQSTGRGAPPADVALVELPDDELLAGIAGEGPLTVAEIKDWLANPDNHVELQVELPLGLIEGAGTIKGLDSNPLTRAKIELGRQLYFDTRLSADNTVSCASCHHPEDGYARHTRFGVGIRGQEGDRNSPVSYNRILSDKQFWDGRAGSLEEQAVGPIQNPIEMGNTHEACVKTLAGIEGYRLQFEKIFGQLTIEAVGQALASFERVIVTGPSPFDYQRQVDSFAGVDLEDLEDSDPEAYDVYKQFVADAEANPMSESAKRGMKIYFSEKGNCSVCHVGANLTDELYYNLGVGMDAENPDPGRMKVTGDEKDYGAFKTPTIRNVALSAPYMHDGSQKTLEEVVEWYAKGGHPNKNLHQRVKKLDLTAQDKQDLVAFMQACTGAFPKVEMARLPE